MNFGTLAERFLDANTARLDRMGSVVVTRTDGTEGGIVDVTIVDGILHIVTDA